MEFMQLPCVQEASLDEPSTQLINVVSIIRNELRERLRMKGKWGVSHVSPKSHVPRNESLRSPTVEMQSICQALSQFSFQLMEPVAFLTQGQGPQSLLPSFIESFCLTMSEVRNHM